MGKSDRKLEFLLRRDWPKLPEHLTQFIAGEFSFYKIIIFKLIKNCASLRLDGIGIS